MNQENQRNYEWYDFRKGWAATQPGWHECSIGNIEVEKYVEIVDWMYDNIDNCERHARWQRPGIKRIQWGYVYETACNFKFRYERDYVLFMLRWG